MKTLPTWAAVVALGAGVATTVSFTPPAFGQAADLQFKAAREKEAREKADQKRENQDQTRDDRRAAKREREQLDNMPKPVKRVLKAETEGASNIDYYKDKGEGKEPTTFGAKFTKADGHNYDLHVDREGTVISRTDLTAQAQQAAARAPATPAPVTPAPAPTPAPPTAQAPTTPAPTAPAASNDKAFRRLQANEIPQNVRTVLDREAQGGKDIRYYRTAYGQKSSYTVKWDDGKGVEHKTYVGDDGAVLARKDHTEGDDDETAATASSSTKADKSDKSDNEKLGRIELNAMPKQAQTQIRRLTEGASDVKFYRTRYGSQDAFQANYTSKDGKSHRVFVDENGKILSQKDEPAPNARTSSK
jgi:hypothetical protein